LKESDELKQNMDLLFGKELEYLTEDDLVYIFDRIRFRLRQRYLAGFPTEWKMCDKCNATFHKHTLDCTECGNEKLRAFTVDPNPYYYDILRELKPSTGMEEGIKP